MLELPQAGEAPAPAESAHSGGGKKIIYSLNPFDRGAQRDLGAPVEVDDPTAGEEEGA